MTKTGQNELALSLDELDTVVGGGATPTGYFHPVAIQAGTPGSDFASTSAVLSAANNFGLPGHFNLSFPTMLHGASHPADGTAPSVPGVTIGGPAVGADDRGALAALPLSHMPVPAQLGDAAAPAAATPDAATATATTDASAVHYFGLPGGADTGHAASDHPATNHWAPGSFGDSAPASFAPGW